MSYRDFLREDCYIAGTWVGADDNGVIEVTNPATGETLGSVPDLGRAATRQAIDAAHEAFADWRTCTADERSRFAIAFHDALMDHQDALGELLTREMGKPLVEA
ncbi:MAG: aldehyde dehydrogenase family protein, partial [Hyphococcus sp.]